MENINHALYQFLGILFFLSAVTLLYDSIDYQIEHLHRQKTLNLE